VKFETQHYFRNHIRLTTTAFSILFSIRKVYRKARKTASNSLGKLQVRNPPRHSPPPAREYWRAQPPRKSTRDPRVDPSHPSPPSCQNQLLRHLACSHRPCAVAAASPWPGVEEGRCRRRGPGVEESRAATATWEQRRGACRRGGREQRSSTQRRMGNN
jgi:hypothetical protein